MTHVFRSEPFIAKDGGRWLTVYRREVLSASDEAIELGPVERAQVPEGEPSTPNWQTTGGLLGRGCHLTRERMKTCGYSITPPKEIRQ